MDKFKSIFYRLLDEDANSAAGVFGPAAAAAASNPDMQGPQIYGGLDARPFDPATAALGAKVKSKNGKRNIKQKDKKKTFPVMSRRPYLPS